MNSVITGWGRLKDDMCLGPEPHEESIPGLPTPNRLVGLRARVNQEAGVEPSSASQEGLWPTPPSKSMTKRYTMKGRIGIDLAQDTFTATFLPPASPPPNTSSPTPTSTPPSTSPVATAAKAASPNAATATCAASSTSSPNSSCAPPGALDKPISATDR